MDGLGQYIRSNPPSNSSSKAIGATTPNFIIFMGGVNQQQMGGLWDC